jgi:hypothetical protein
MEINLDIIFKKDKINLIFLKLIMIKYNNLLIMLMIN